MWLYNLHYFDDLTAQNADERKQYHRSLIDQWIVENLPGQGNGWESYPISLRVVNWIKWSLQGNSLSDEQLFSLFDQTRWLSQKLEYHLLGNHLLANSKALVFAGLFFKGRLADRWLDKGVSILDAQIKEQVLDDGGHFERSPMYHAIILEDILDVIQIAGIYGGKIREKQVVNWRNITVKMVSALKAMCHPDGDIAFFNDAAMGIAPKPAQLVSYAQHLGIIPWKQKKKRVQFLSETGYLCISRKMIQLLVDVAPVGPDYLPGHAHADTLSFELSIGKQRVFVNSGTSCYGQGQERLHQRRTPAHNTLAVDGLDSSEVWSGFRVARRARIRHYKIESSSDQDVIEASHDGFSRIKTLGLHHRKWSLSDTALKITDRLEGKGIHQVCLYFHFHPLIRVTSAPDELVLMNLDNEVIGKIKIDTAFDFEIKENTYHPEFGKSIPSKILVARIRTELPFQCQNRIDFS